MSALFAGLTTLDVLHRIDHTPEANRKVTSTDFTMAAGGPATNAAVTYAALQRLAAQTGRKHAHGDGSAREGERAHGDTPAQEAVALLSAIGGGPVGAFLAEELAGQGVRVLDATHAPAHSDTAHTDTAHSDTAHPDAPANAATHDTHTPISSIVEHPHGRMVVSTNARAHADATRAATLIEGEAPSVVLVDGHHPELAALALTLGVPTPTGEDVDPFASLDAKPSHQRIYDGGSWKQGMLPLLGYIDIAIISEDFTPPLLKSPDGDQIADFFRGFGVSKVVRTRGEKSVQYWWDGVRGDVEVQPVEGASTLGAGDAFHGAFAWALTHSRAEALSSPERLIAFACAASRLAVSSFGTRQWLAAAETAQLVRDYLG